MKKSLLFLAVLGTFASLAQAQSSVTIYGSIDGGIRNLTNVNAAGDNRVTMSSNGTYNSNRLGFKGVEDLGGGMNAHFTLESGFNTGTGTLDNTANRLFNRSAYVGVGGAWGALDFGRQYSINFKVIGTYDPFSYKYTAIVPLAAQGGLTRFDNDIQYTGTFGPVTARAEYALGEQAGSTSNGSTRAVGINYADGAFSAGGVYTQRKNLIGTNYADQKNWTLGGAFTTGPIRLAIGYADSKQATGLATSDTRVKDIWLGGTYSFTPAAALTAGYYRTQYTAATGNTDGRKNLLIIGGTYALSKRTNFYADIDNTKFKGTAIGTVSPATKDRQTGISVGINHLF